MKITALALPFALTLSASATAETIEGTVRDDHGQPAVGVEVQAVDPKHPPMYDAGPPWMLGKTDFTGHFRITNAYPAEMFIFAHGDDVLPSERVKITVTANGLSGVTLMTPKAVELRGRVVDETGKPLAGAFVYAESSFRLRPGTGDESARHQGSSYADAEGRFSIRGLPPGATKLRLSKQGLPNAVATATAPAEGVELRMTHGESLSGTVVDAAGKPVAHAQIRLNRQHEDDKFEALGGAGFANADAEGHFTVDGVKPGTYWVTAADRKGRNVFATATVPALNPLRIVFPAFEDIRGRVVNTSPLPTARLMIDAYDPDLHDPPSDRPPLFHNSGHAQVADDGTFVLEGLVPGHYTVFASGYADKVHVESEGAKVVTGRTDLVLNVPAPTPAAK